MRNEAVVLRSRPFGVAQAENFSILEAPLVDPADGQIVVQNEYLSVEPAMRGWIADTGNYSQPIGVGSVMRSIAAGRVIASRHPYFREGDAVVGWFGWQRFATVDAEKVVRKIAETDLPISLSLGVLGINGVTAYLALKMIGQPRSGDTVVVSTAAGAVGSAAGQIAKIRGARTVGIAGGREKGKICREEFGYDATIDYRSDDVDARLAAECRSGVNVYFDNTAGAISDVVHRHLANKSRIIVCGTASISRWDEWPTGPRLERHLLVKRARIEGFVIFDHMDHYEEAVIQLTAWVRDGRLRYREEVLDGLETCPDALAGLYRGENYGKRVIRI